MPVSAQSRLHVLNNPILAPGVCFLCGSAGDGKRKFIDFGKQIEWYGTVYICTECIVEVSSAADYIPVANFDNLHNAYRELQVKYDQLVVRYEPFEKAISNVVESRTSKPDLDFDNLRSRISGVEKPEEQRVNDNEAVSGESKANESDNVEGPDDLFDTTDFDDD
jgi:hypothetical protein